MTNTRWLNEDEQRAWRGYLAMNTQLTARLARQLQNESSLSLGDFEVLVHLTDQPENQLRIGELATKLQWEKSRLSHHLNRMERRGLVRKTECAEDARGMFIVVTEQGREAIEQAAPRHVDVVREYFFDQLDNGQIDNLREIAEAVLKKLDSDG